jgi:hypothetical protein
LCKDLLEGITLYKNAERDRIVEERIIIKFSIFWVSAHPHDRNCAPSVLIPHG